MKLDDLCAIKVMDWAMNIQMFPGGLEYAVWVNVKDNSPTLYYDHISQSIWRDPQFLPIASKQWRPSVDLNDALVCLERAVGEDKWNCGKWSNGYNKVKYYCEIHRSPSEGAYGDTLALAMCRAALRAIGVPESEISLAMEDI